MDATVAKILKWFEAVNAIPRCSHNEKKIIGWLRDWADQNGFGHATDAASNLVVRVPASTGFENAPVIVLQGHVDMVCEKTPQSNHDFDTDPIRLLIGDEWVQADGTTLGADNGIAIALALMLATEKSAPHPPLELLFTVNEETGLNGAKELPHDFITGKIMLNLDSEDTGVFTVGCAGGRDTRLTLPLTWAHWPAEYVSLRLSVGGLTGGHSGIDIDKGRANANKILAGLLQDLDAHCTLCLADFSGGTGHNVIPRDAVALIGVARNNEPDLRERLASHDAALKTALAATDPDFCLSLDPAEPTERVLEAACGHRLLQLMLALPHGVAAISSVFSGSVETSSNLAMVEFKTDQGRLLISQRSATADGLDGINAQIKAVAALGGARAVDTKGYPPWTPNPDSPLLQRCRSLHKQLFAEEPVIESIHAGIECAIIGAKYPGIDMISFGPTIESPHSPNERMHIPAIGQVWQFLVALMASWK